MAFYGSKFLQITLGVLTYVAICGLFMILPYNFGLISLTASKGVVIGWIVGTFIVGSLIGLLAAYFFTKFAKKCGTTLLGAMTGVILTFLLISPMIKNDNIQLVVVIVLALLGGYAGFKLNRYVRVYSTSIIGAGLLAIGANSFFGGLTFLNLKAVKDQDLKQVTPIYAAYLVGFIFISVAGIYVQLKYTDKEEHKEDDFMDPNKYAWYQSINYYI